MDRLTQTSNKGGVAFTFDLDITCEPKEARKILRLAEKMKLYEDLGTVEELQELKERATPMKISKPLPNMYECPWCGETQWINPIIEYCPWCGQKLDC